MDVGAHVLFKAPLCSLGEYIPWSPCAFQSSFVFPRGITSLGYNLSYSSVFRNVMAIETIFRAFSQYFCGFLMKVESHCNTIKSNLSITLSISSFARCIGFSDNVEFSFLEFHHMCSSSDGFTVTMAGSTGRDNANNCP